MKYLYLASLLITLFVLSGCGGADSAVVGSPVAAIETSTMTPVPTSTVTSVFTPTETATPTTAPTATPTPIQLSDVDLESIIRSVPVPEGYDLRSGVVRPKMFSDLPVSDNEYAIQVHRDNDLAGHVSVFLFDDDSLVEQAFYELYSGFVVGEGLIEARATLLRLDNLGEVSAGIRYSTQFEDTYDLPLNYGFMDAIFAECSAVVHVRFMAPDQVEIYTEEEMYLLSEEVTLYVRRLESELASKVCTGQEEHHWETPTVIPPTPELALTPVADLPSPTTTPLRLLPVPARGSSLTNPIPFGEAARVTRYGGDAVFEVAVVDVVRGATASNMMYQANSFNGKPADPALEWMLVRMRGKAVKVTRETGTGFGSTVDMRIYASNRLVGQPLGGIPPEPRLDGVYLTGADIDGWVSFFVYKDDPHPILFIEESLFDDEGVFFALSHSTPQGSNTDGNSPDESEPQVRFTGSTTNIRSGPSTQYQVLGTGAQGDILPIIGRNQNSTWWQICCVDDTLGWVAGSVVSVVGDVSAVSLVEDLAAPAPPTQVQPRTENWTLIADSIADYPTNNTNRKWWYLWSDGRFNFRWQDMREDPRDCARPPNSFPAFICSDRAGTDASSDVALQWKAPEGGTYLIEWQADTTKGGGNVYIYRHLQELYSTGPGPSLPNSVTISQVEAWEQFFFVVRTDGDPFETTLHARVYKR